MLILFDHGTPAPLSRYLPGHIVKKAIDLGWDRLTNGELLNAPEKDGFDLLLTTDKNIRYQQNLSSRRIAIVVLGNAQWPSVKLHVGVVVSAVNAVTPGTYIVIEIPFIRGR
jgi:hypothetical protein